MDGRRDIRDGKVIRFETIENNSLGSELYVACLIALKGDHIRRIGVRAASRHLALFKMAS